MLYIHYILLNIITWYYVADMIISAPFQLWSWGVVLKLWLEITLNNQIVRFVRLHFLCQIVSSSQPGLCLLREFLVGGELHAIGQLVVADAKCTSGAAADGQTQWRSGAAAQRRSVRFGAVLAHGVVGSNDLHMFSRYIWYNDMTNVYTNVRVALHSEFAAENKAHSKALSSLVFRSLWDLHGFMDLLRTFWTWENSSVTPGTIGTISSSQGFGNSMPVLKESDFGSFTSARSLSRFGSASLIYGLCCLVKSRAIHPQNFQNCPPTLKGELGVGIPFTLGSHGTKKGETWWNICRSQNWDHQSSTSSEIAEVDWKVRFQPWIL